MSAVSGKVRTKAPRLLARILLYAVLIDLAFLFLYPFLYILITSVKTNRDLLDITVQWIPRSLKWENFSMAIKACNFFSNLKNSAIYTIFGTAGHLLSCAFIGYGFARYRFPGRKLLFLAVLLSIIVPVQTIIIPLYLVYVNMGILGTYLPVILPTFFGFGLRGGLFIFIFRQFFMNLPRELENAAKVDGTPRWRIFTKITLPMISPTVFYLVITGFIGAFKAYSDAVALFGTNLNAAGMNTIVGYIYDMLYGDSGGYPSYASAAAIVLFAIVLTITCINLLVSRKHVHY